MLVFVVTFGVSVSAMSSNTLVSIAVVWMTLYGGGFLLTQLPGGVAVAGAGAAKFAERAEGACTTGTR